MLDVPGNYSKINSFYEAEEEKIEAKANLDKL